MMVSIVAERRKVEPKSASVKANHKLLALSGVLGSSERASAALVAAGLEPTARGEQLTIDDFVALASAAPAVP